MCRFCSKKGHLARVCRAKQRSEGEKDKDSKAHYLREDGTRDGEEEMYDLFTVETQKNKPMTWTVDLTLNGVPATMEVDTGAAISVINQGTFQNVCKQGATAVSLQQSKVQLRTYTGEAIKVLGAAALRVKLGDREEGLFAQVVDGAGPNLLGRDWLSAFEVTLNGLILHTSDLSQPLKGVLDKHAPVLKSDLGCLQGEKVHLFVDETVTPKFCKPRSVPLAMKESVEAELAGQAREHWNHFSHEICKMGSPHRTCSQKGRYNAHLWRFQDNCQQSLEDRVLSTSSRGGALR